MIINFLCSNRKGGLENAFLNLTQALEKLDYTVEQWLPADSPHFDATKTKAFDPKGYYDVTGFWRIRNHLKKTKPRLIITHNSRATHAAGMANLGLGIPHLAFSHGYKSKRFRRASRIVVLTEHMKQHFIRHRYPAERLDILPNMIKELPPLAAYRPPGEVIQLCFIGRLAPEKGLPDLLDAIGILKQQGVRFMLHIAGSGNDSEVIAQRIQRLGLEKEVTIHGWVDGIQSLLSTMDLLALPSRFETFGLVVLEGAAYGCLTVSTRVPGPESQITDGIDGWLAEPANPQDLADTIKRAIDQKTEWSQMREQAHARAQRYTMDSLLPQLDVILKKAQAL